MGIRKTLIANTQPFDAFEGAEKIWTFKRMIYWRNEADGHFLKAAKPLREETLSHAKIWSATFFKKSTPKKNLVTLFFCPRPWDFSMCLLVCCRDGPCVRPQAGKVTSTTTDRLGGRHYGANRDLTRGTDSPYCSHAMLTLNYRWLRTLILSPSAPHPYFLPYLLCRVEEKG